MPFDTHITWVVVSHISPSSELNVVVKHMLTGFKSLFSHFLTVGS